MYTSNLANTQSLLTNRVGETFCKKITSLSWSTVLLLQSNNGTYDMQMMIYYYCVICCYNVHIENTEAIRTGSSSINKHICSSLISKLLFHKFISSLQKTSTTKSQLLKHIWYEVKPSNYTTRHWHWQIINTMEERWHYLPHTALYILISFSTESALRRFALSAL